MSEVVEIKKRRTGIDDPAALRQQRDELLECLKSMVSGVDGPSEIVGYFLLAEAKELIQRCEVHEI